jgi:hypothetical protein
MSRMASRAPLDLTRGGKRGPGGCAQHRRSSPARAESFRRDDGFPRPTIIRMGRLEERQHLSRACRGKERNLPKLIFPAPNVGAAICHTFPAGSWTVLATSTYLVALME